MRGSSVYSSLQQIAERGAAADSENLRLLHLRFPHTFHHLLLKTHIGGDANLLPLGQARLLLNQPIGKLLCTGLLIESQGTVQV